MRYEFLEDVVLSPVAVKGLPEEAWERAESSRRVGTTCLVLRDDHSQEGVVMEYVTLIFRYTMTPTIRVMEPSAGLRSSIMKQRSSRIAPFALYPRVAFS